MIIKSELNATFYRPMLKSLALLLGGFLLAPTSLLLSIYQHYHFFRWIAILTGSFIVIFALKNMVSISLRAMNGPAFGRNGTA